MLPLWRWRIPFAGIPAHFDATDLEGEPYLSLLTDADKQPFSICQHSIFQHWLCVHKVAA